MRAPRFGFADSGYAQGLCQACGFLAEVGERSGERFAAPPVQASLELESSSRPRGSAFVGLRTLPPESPNIQERKIECPSSYGLLGVPIVVIVLLYLLNIV
jgi:hypothetical protein